MQNTAARIASASASLIVFSLIIVLGLTAPCPAQAASFTPGNLVLLQMGTGSNILFRLTAACFLTEYTTNGTMVQSIPVPTAASGGNFPLTLPFETFSGYSRDGILKRSLDRRYLTFGGYGVNPGFLDPAASNAMIVSRVVGRVSSDGNMNTTTALTNFPSATPFPSPNPYYLPHPIVSVASTDGTHIWLGGADSTPTSAQSGVAYTTLGSRTCTALASNRFTRVVNIHNNQLYVSAQATPTLGVAMVGTGLPTAAIGGAPSLLPGFPSSGTHSSYDFWFKDDTTLYVADYGSAANGGGIQKWGYSAGQWLLQYILLNNGSSNIPAYALTGTVDGNGNAVLYVTTGANYDNKLITVTDTGADAMPTVIADAPTNTAFRGVDFAPVAAIGGPKITAVSITGDNLRLDWETTGGTTNFVQARGSLSSDSFSDISNPIYIPGTGPATTNFTEPNGANNPTRYYQIRSVKEE